VDGNVSFENAVLMSQAGADNFVAGTAGLFRKDMRIEEAAARLRECIK
jgi:pentose-5-phosphate-3-epimerase